MRRIKVTCDSKQPCSVLCHVIPPTLLRVADGRHYAGSVRDAALTRPCCVSVPAGGYRLRNHCAGTVFPKVVPHCLIIPHMATVMMM